jgi:hypothetical protein
MQTLTQMTMTELMVKGLLLEAITTLLILVK